MNDEENLIADISARNPTWAKGLVHVTPESLGLLFSEVRKQKTYTLCTENICKVLNWRENFLLKDLFGSFRYDEFRTIMEYRPPNGKWRPLEDADFIDVQTRISIVFDFFQKVSRSMVQDAVMKVSMDAKYDSAKDYLDTLVWDEVPRLDTWLTKAYGVEDNVYHRAVASNWIKGLVMRILEPGCKFDNILVLEGDQGMKKSMSLKKIVGKDWYVETTMGTDNKDFFQMLQGKLIVEFSEGETYSKSEFRRMKAIITTEVDRFRPSYGRVTKDFPRRCVFVMTTNDDEYLKDPTGNRRWLPVKVISAESDIVWMDQNAKQLLAEAKHRLLVLKENYWEFPLIETLEEQKKRRVSDPNEDLIANWYLNVLTEKERSEGITIHQAFTGVFRGAFGTDKPMAKFEQMQISEVLKETLHLVKKQTMQDKVRLMRWYSPKAIVIQGIVNAAIEKLEAGNVQETEKAVEQKEEITEEIHSEIPF